MPCGHPGSARSRRLGARAHLSVDWGHDRSRPVEFACPSLRPLTGGAGHTTAVADRSFGSVRPGCGRAPGRWMTTLQEEGSATDGTDNHRARRTTMAVVTMRQLLESGVHFGHQTRRWNPKMKRFIMTERNGIYIIDLQQSVTYINNAYEFVKETVAHGGTILFVGTKRQAQEPIAEQATRVGHALRQPPLARWHAHQLPDDLQAAHPPQGARGARLRRRGRLRLHEEGAAHLQAREGQARAHPGRHPHHGPRPLGRLDRRHQEGAPRGRRGPQARPAGHRDPRHQLRPRRGRLQDPGQRRRDPFGHPAHPRHRGCRRRGPDRPRRWPRRR